MRVLHSKKKWIVLGVLVVAAGVGVGVAVATLTQNELANTTSVRLRIVRFEFVPSTNQQTFSSGWHTHPGPVIVQVQTGRLKITQGPPCHTTNVGSGETYIETPEFAVLATAKKAVKWTTSMILPADKPFATNLASGPCAANGDDDDD